MTRAMCSAWPGAWPAWASPTATREARARARRLTSPGDVAEFAAVKAPPALLVEDLSDADMPRRRRRGPRPRRAGGASS